MGTYKFFHAVYRMRQGAYAAVVTRGQQMRYSIYGFWRYQRLITLDIDNDLLVVEFQDLAGLGQTVAATDVVWARHDGFYAMGLAGQHHAFIIRCDNNAAC
jgi:hypothetical protein